MGEAICFAFRAFFVPHSRCPAGDSRAGDSDVTLIHPPRQLCTHPLRGVQVTVVPAIGDNSTWRALRDWGILANA